MHRSVRDKCLEYLGGSSYIRELRRSPVSSRRGRTAVQTGHSTAALRQTNALMTALIAPQRC